MVETLHEYPDGLVTKDPVQNGKPRPTVPPPRLNSPEHIPGDASRPARQPPKGRKHDGSGFRRGHVPRSPNANVASKDPARAILAHRNRDRARGHFEHLETCVEGYGRQLQELGVRVKSYQNMKGVVEAELDSTGRAIREAEKGIVSLHGFDSGMEVSSRIKREIELDLR